jgi:hypothetical protein
VGKNDDGSIYFRYQKTVDLDTVSYNVAIGSDVLSMHPHLDGGKPSLTDERTASDPYFRVLGVIWIPVGISVYDPDVKRWNYIHYFGGWP